CNAGFSTIHDGLTHPALRHNQSLHLILAALFILGGLGFTIVLNTFTFIKRWIKNLYCRLIYGRPFRHRAWVINFNSRLIAYTTVLLLVFGTGTLFLLEYYQGLRQYDSMWSKLLAAFFIGATPRSAGLSP